MAIITKPVGGILKGVPASISLSKSELSALSIIVADSYFSNTSNWNKVILKYRSSTGKQYEAVQFDATLSSPTGNFLVSIKARDVFEIQTIEIHDFDNDIFIVPRSALNVADFDVVLLSAPSSLSYSTPVTYTQNTAITNNVPTVTGTVTSYSILPALPAGLSLNTTTGVISGTPTEVSAAANYIVTASNEAGSTTATINITVVESMEEFDIVNFTGRNSSTYISFPAPGSVTRLLPAVNLENNGQGSFWSTTPLSGDFTFIATVKAGSVSDGPVQALFGLNDVMPPPSNSGYGLKAAGWGLNFYNDGSVVRPWDVGVDTLAYTKGSTYNIEIKRVSGVVSYKVNSTTFSYTLSTSDTVYLVGYLQVGSWELTNAQLAVPEVPVGDPIIWQSKPGYIIEADGGATATPERPNYGEYYRVLAPSSQWVTGDFTFQAEINNAWQGNDYIGFYSSDTDFSLTTGFNGSQVRYEQSSPTSYVKPAGDTYTLKMQRIGYVLKFYVNDVEVYSVTQTNLSTVKVPFFTFTDSAKHIVSATLLLPTATNYINWDLLTGYQAGSLTITPTSGVSGGISLAGDDVAVKSDADKATGDFDYTFKFDWSSASSVNNMFAGVTGNNVTSGTSPLFYDRLTCIYGNGNNPDTANLWHNGSSVGGTTQTLLSGVNTYRLKRVGTTITHYLNDVQIYSATSTSFTAYPSVRTMGNSVVTESYITEASELSYFLYNQLGTGHTTDAFGAISSSTSLNSQSFNTTAISGDFDVEYTFDAALPSSATDSIFGLKQTLDSTNNYIGFLTVNGFVSTYFSAASQNSLTQESGQNIFRIKRTGSLIDFYLNGVKTLNSHNFSGDLYLVVRANAGFDLISTVDNLGTGSNFVPVTWNVAGKTGVGTVTTGANGLITKATGGSSYNVNVLSNETITGDGYVEFINSSSFINVIFGIAEINDPSGFFSNIIIGGYNTGAAGLEKVYNDGTTFFYGGGVGSIAVGDVLRFGRIGTTYYIKINGTQVYSITNSNTNPVKASVTIYAENYGVNNVTISE